MHLPPDGHVHTEWSWDAQFGSMERSCVEALRLGLPAIAFTEHLDHTVWTVGAAALAELPRDDGGDAATCGSDAHDPSSVSRDFPEAAALAEANGVRPAHNILEPWGRS